MSSCNVHSSRLLKWGLGSWATAKTTVHLSIIQITVLSTLFAGVRKTMLVFGTMLLQQFAYLQLHVFKILNILYRHFLFIPKCHYFLT